ncbi:MAG: hypothetical protein MR286_00780 [Clostridiales bacterium]|nr:hypothetical protein [Clostridiales bacterium]
MCCPLRCLLGCRLLLFRSAVTSLCLSFQGIPDEGVEASACLVCQGAVFVYVLAA